MSPTVLQCWWHSHAHNGSRIYNKRQKWAILIQGWRYFRKSTILKRVVTGYDFWIFYLTSSTFMKTEFKWASLSIDLQFYKNIGQEKTRFLYSNWKNRLNITRTFFKRHSYQETIMIEELGEPLMFGWNLQSVEMSCSSIIFLSR